MQRFRLCLLILSLFTMTGCFTNDPTDIPIVGIDRFGFTHEEFVSQKEFTKNMRQTLNMVNDSTVMALDTAQTKSAVELKSVAIGVGINATIKIPQLVTLGTSARVRLFFSQDDDIIIP